MEMPPGWGKYTRLDHVIDGRIEDQEDWILEDMARRGDERAEAELLRRGIEPPPPAGPPIR